MVLACASTRSCCFAKFIEQHRVHRLIADRVHPMVCVTDHQVRGDFFHFLRHEPELRRAVRVYLGLVPEGDRAQGKDGLARGEPMSWMSVLKRRDEVSVPSWPVAGLMYTAAPLEAVAPEIPAMIVCVWVPSLPMRIVLASASQRPGCRFPDIIAPGGEVVAVGV